ncbi:MAG: glycosyltransferase family 2 protein [Gammaproteobacteria bacterium]|nr:glycosyltransferase family 2 protein [Gammaproteobacteria bacterium]
MPLTIIVPVLNEAGALPALCQRLARLPGAEIIVADGGSNDGSREWLDQWQDGELKRVTGCTTGRAEQMNAAAQVARGQLLLFLHADTQLPERAIFELDKLHGAPLWGRFDVAFDDPSPVMRVIAWFISKRSRLTGIATGDQAMFVSRDLFERVGGFDELPIMEDIALSKKLKQFSPPICLLSKVVTSARRWRQNGIVKTVLLMWGMRLAFFLGVPARRLAHFYRVVR